MAEEVKYPFIVLGKKVEITENEIRNLPKQIKEKEDELVFLKQLHSQAINRQTLKFALLLDNYYQRLSKHLLIYRSGIRVKFITVMIQRKFSPVFFVQAQIEFNANKTFKSIRFVEFEPNETKQIVNVAKGRLFTTAKPTAIRADKAFKRKCNRAAMLIKDNYVKRNVSGADRCNEMLRGWIAEIF